MITETTYFAKNQVVKTLFDIGQDIQAGSQHTLLLEVGTHYCNTALLHKGSSAIDRMQFVVLDEFALAKEVAELVRPWKDVPFESVVVCPAFAEALLFPAKIFNNDYSLLDAIYQQPAQRYFHDSIPEWQVVNAYGLPQALYDTLADAFPSAAYLHAYSPAIKIYNGYVADNQLLVHFTEQSFRVLLKKEMAIQLVQTYAYKTPLDVVYYLLKICYTFELSQQNLFLILSGLMEKDSNLFAELLHFFSNIHFAQQPEIGLPESPHPHYFFTSIYNLAACVL